MTMIRILEEFRDPVVRPDFKSGRGCQQSLVGSTPMLFRHSSFPEQAARHARLIDTRAPTHYRFRSR